MHLWRDRLARTEARSLPASELYAGDHWHAALVALERTLRFSSRSELWVVSAGYGLIPVGAAIKPYSATFAAGHADSVWRGASDGVRRQQLESWWGSLANGTTLVDLASTKSGDALVIVAGASYLDAIGQDLARAVTVGGETVSVISAGSRAVAALLPVTSRLRSHVGGTDSAINSRVLALLAADAAHHKFRRGLMAAHLERLNSTIADVPRRTGTRVSDAEIKVEITKMRKRTPAIARSAGLRDLRQRGIACEQGRFAALWPSS